MTGVIRSLHGVLIVSLILAACQNSKSIDPVDVQDPIYPSSADIHLTLLSHSANRTADLPSKVPDGVILHAYLWRFTNITASLPQIAAAGYKAIQVSPLQGTKGTGAWWLLYQPTNLSIGNSQLGTEAEFKSLCESAARYDIKIIVDAVLNHVADNGTDGGFDPQVDSTIRSHKADWFHNRGTISNYQDREQVTQKNLGNGPDWNTQNPEVQQRMLAFLNQCVLDGAGGFRFDAAKHIETSGGEDSGKSWSGNFWGNIYAGLSNRASLYLYGEVLPDEGDNDEQYLKYFPITAHGYLWTVAQAIDAQDLSSVLVVNHYNHPIHPSRALVYAENHDTYEHGETSKFSYRKRLASYAIMLARNAMTTLVLDRPDDEIWSDTLLAGLIHFHNAMVGQSEYLRFPSKPVLLVERGTKGMVLINAGASPYTLNTPTMLADGSYLDKGSTHETFVAAKGNLTGTLPAYSIGILYDKSGTTSLSPRRPKRG